MLGHSPTCSVAATQAGIEQKKVVVREGNQVLREWKLHWSFELQVFPGGEVRSEGSRAESTEGGSTIFPQEGRHQRTDGWTSRSCQGVAERMIWPAKPGLEKERSMG